MDKDTLISVLFILIIILFIVFLSVFIKARKKHYKEFVLNHSVAYKTILAIKKKFNFKDVYGINLNHEYDNKNMFNDISCFDYLVYYLNNNTDKVNRILSISLYNKLNYPIFQSKIKDIQRGEFDKDIGNLKLKQLLKLEDKFIEELIARPHSDLFIYVLLKRTDIHHYYTFDTQKDSFSENEIIDVLRRLNNRSGDFYKDQEIWNSLCRVERGKVSNKLRFAVYERDNYTCQMCGKSDYEANLEVDHIIPISKGGKSTMDNLQTLCHECNQKKGNKIY